MGGGGGRGEGEGWWWLGAGSISHQDVSTILKTKKFSSSWKLLEIAEIDAGINFGSKRTIMT